MIQVDVHDCNHKKPTIWVQEHRWIWEQEYQACLLPWAIVHHKNEIKDDNRPENLVAMMRYQHITYIPTRKSKKQLSIREVKKKEGSLTAFIHRSKNIDRKYCSTCQRWIDPSEIKIGKHGYKYHIECDERIRNGPRWTKMREDVKRIE